MNIAVCSMFRDSQVWCGQEINQVDRYFRQLMKQTCGFKNITVVGMEGNSVDNTMEKLQEYVDMFPNVHIYNQTNEYDTVASIENDNRLKGLSRVGDMLISKVLQIEDLDYVLWIESDLIFDISLIKDLLFAASHYTQRDCIIAPMIYLDKKGIFYDTWGFRELDGTRWTERHRERVALTNPLKEMSSIGSCALIDANLLRCGVRFGQGAFVELCERARHIGGKVYVDVNTKVYHPGSHNLNKRWV